MLRDFLKKLLGEKKKDDAKKVYDLLKKDKNGYFNGSMTAGVVKMKHLNTIQKELKRLSEKGIDSRFALKYAKFSNSLTTKELTGIISTLKQI